MPGRPGQDRRDRRLRGGADRLRAGRRAEDHEAGARPPPEGRCRGAYRHLVELRGGNGLALGESVTVEAFQPGEKVKVSGIGIGKGFQGTIKRHNFKRGPKSHGSHNVRAPGSIGASATPSRVFKGIKMAGRMGGKRVTQVGLVIHAVDPEQNLLLVKGSVPGPKNGFVEVREVTR